MKQVLKSKVHSDAKTDVRIFEIYVIEKAMTSQKLYEVISF